jgi:hypothetical protein
MPIRARVTELKVGAIASLKRMDVLIAEVGRSLNVIESRLRHLTATRKARFIGKRDPRHRIGPER